MLKLGGLKGRGGCIACDTGPFWVARGLLNTFTLGAMPRCEPEVWAERFADSELREPMPVADYMRWLKETLEEEVHLNSPMMPLVGLMDVFV